MQTRPTNFLQFQKDGVMVTGFANVGSTIILLEHSVKGAMLLCHLHHPLLLAVRQLQLLGQNV
nr:hypothetical protein Iba_scaffold29547CG0010 [Ipomoea batatas]GMC94874.1 hypothetical protein Iba_chr05cCG3150 [Ipomoea batatas]